jgi:hypothetical protein
MCKLLRLLILTSAIILPGCFGGDDSTDTLQNIMDLPISVLQMLTDGDAQIAATKEGL